MSCSLRSTTSMTGSVALAGTPRQRRRISIVWPPPVFCLTTPTARLLLAIHRALRCLPVFRRIAPGSTATAKKCAKPCPTSSCCQRPFPRRVTGPAVRARCCTTSSMPAPGTNTSRPRKPRIRSPIPWVHRNAPSASPAAGLGNTTRPTGDRLTPPTRNTAAITRSPNGSGSTCPRNRRNHSFWPAVFIVRTSRGLYRKSISTPSRWTRSSCLPAIGRMTWTTCRQRARAWPGTDTLPTSGPTSSGSKASKATSPRSTLPTLC